MPKTVFLRYLGPSDVAHDPESGLSFVAGGTPQEVSLEVAERLMAPVVVPTRSLNGGFVETTQSGPNTSRFELVEAPALDDLTNDVSEATQELAGGSDDDVAGDTTTSGED